MKFVYIILIGALIWFAVNGQWLFALITFGLSIAFFAIHIMIKNNIAEKEYQRKLREEDERFRAKREEEDRQIVQEHQRKLEKRDQLLKNNADYTKMGDIFSTDRQIFSERGRDYSGLRDALNEKRWISANNFTMNEIRTLINHGDISFGNFRLKDESCPILSRDLLRIPMTDLVTMDRLWSQYTNGKFGFWTQYKLFLEVDRDFEAFCKKVGWNGNWKEEEDAPAGHFPNSLFYYLGGFLLEETQRSKELVKKVVRSPFKPVSQPVERDENWYEDRYASPTISKPEDNYSYDSTKGDWYREVYDFEYYGENISDPSHGFLNLVSLIEKANSYLK